MCTIWTKVSKKKRSKDKRQKRGQKIGSDDDKGVKRKDKVG